MVYQYQTKPTKPFITICEDINCWSRKTIKEHFGDWAPTHIDAAVDYCADDEDICFIKGNLVYTAFGNTTLHTMFEDAPCNVTAAGGSKWKYFFRCNAIYDRGDYDGITCFN